jgi:hypothetical protein
MPPTTAKLPLKSPKNRFVINAQNCVGVWRDQSHDERAEGAGLVVYGESLAS